MLPDGVGVGPHPQSKGRPHTLEGSKIGSDGHIYRQQILFGEGGEIMGRVDYSSHGRRDHPDIHFHHPRSQYSFKTPPLPYVPDFTLKSRK